MGDPWMSRVRIYTKTTCIHSLGAKEILCEKGVSFEEVDIAKEPHRRDEMIQAANGRHTTPQIFIEGRHVGGESDLIELEERGELDELLAGPRAST